MSRARRAAPAPGLGGTRLIETLLGGWRALARMDVDGFALQRSRGVTRRASSAVLIDAPSTPEALEAAVERTVQLQTLGGQRPLFRVFEIPGADHTQLDSLLAERGYEREAPVLVLQRELSRSETLHPDDRAQVEVGTPGEDWLAAHWQLSPRPEEGARETLRDIMTGTPAIYVSIRQEGQILGVGRAALVPAGRRTAAVLDAITVDEAHRRRGVGRGILQTLLAAAVAQQADLALLEVETDNAAARALYRTAGFAETGGYHYRAGE